MQFCVGRFRGLGGQKEGKGIPAMVAPMTIPGAAGSPSRFVLADDRSLESQEGLRLPA